MILKVKDISNLMEKIAPLNLKEDFDNVGLMVGDTNSCVGDILVSLDCTLDVIKEAKEKGCNFILTHHPLLFIKPKSITNETLQGTKILELIKNDIALYSAHTNLDSVKGGINDYAMELLGFKEFEIMDKSHIKDYEDNSGLGRICTLNNKITLKELCNKIKSAYEVNSLRVAGNLEKEISRVALINGSGQDFFFKAKEMGADCIITGDTTYHFVSDFKEEDIAIIDAGHFKTEWPAMKVVAKILEKNLNKLGYTNKVYISEKSEDPYKFI